MPASSGAEIALGTAMQLSPSKQLQALESNAAKYWFNKPGPDLGVTFDSAQQLSDARINKNNKQSYRINKNNK
eukprot:768731-Hanusia_phi.AAC.6